MTSWTIISQLILIATNPTTVLSCQIVTSVKCPKWGLICIPTYQSKMVLSCQIVTSVKCLKWRPKWGLICMHTYQSKKRCCHAKLSLQWSVSNDVPNEVSFSCLPTNLKNGVVMSNCHFSEVSQMTSQTRFHFHAYLRI
jgi:hypothetical protein